MSRIMSHGLAAFAGLLLVVSSAAVSKAAPIVVDAKSNIFGAGRSAAPDPGGFGGGILPPVLSFTPGDNLEVIFNSVTGSVSYNNDAGDPNRGQFNGPDGGAVSYPPAVPDAFNVNVLSYGGISGMTVVESRSADRRVMFLTGVFLNDNEPSGAAPERLDFSSYSLGRDFDTLSPGLNQTFFIGDGLTGTGTGNKQRFIVPSGATRLFLGIVDAADFLGKPTFYDNNDGAFLVDVSVVPEPASGTLVLCGVSLLAGLFRRRR